MDNKPDSPYPADKYMADIVRWALRKSLRDKRKSVLPQKPQSNPQKKDASK